MLIINYIIMSLRWRRSGELLCGAKSEPEKNDVYINDRLHYELAVNQKCVCPDRDEEKNGKWYWVHGENGVFISRDKF